MSIVKKYKTWQLYKKTVNELSRMNDRDLADIGIGRYDIKQVAREHVRLTS